MSLALSLGRRGLGRTWPNPSVGCVIVGDGVIVGRGWTADGGRPHAETRALAQAGARAQGATAYVTLEPCSHHGQTPPCAQALIDAGVAHVVAAIQDNDRRVDGNGFAMLRAAGIQVTTGVLADQAAQDHAGFFMRNGLGRPWVTLKLANSFDGRIATATGDSQWITGPDARRLVHGMRAQHDAVLVGAGTVRADDPTLNVRDLGIAHHTLRVVISRHLDIPIASRLVQTVDNLPLWVCHGDTAPSDRIDAWRNIGAQTISCALQGQGVDPGAVLSALAQRGITRVFCEGGGNLAASMLAADLVDELIGFQAGVVIGAEGLPSIGAMGVDQLKSAPRFKLHQLTEVQGDVLQTWRRDRTD